MLTIQERSLAQVRSELPRVYYKSYTMRCPWKIKGSLMRHLIESHPQDRLSLIDGVKVINPHNDDWVLILPDAGDALVHIYANSEDKEWLDNNLNIYRDRVRQFIDRESGYGEH
jgi:mannose-1-phosphate guanylyltransferase / phosphomannomutase